MSLDLFDYHPRLWPFRFLDWRDIVVANPSDVSYPKRLSELSGQFLQSAKEAGSGSHYQIIYLKKDSFFEVDAGTTQLILQSNALE